jgi:hypothetical protein
MLIHCRLVLHRRGQTANRNLWIIDSFSDNEYSNTARTLQKGPTPTAFFTTTTATSSSTSYSSTHLPRKLFFTTRESFTKNEQFKTVRNTVEGYDNQERTWSCTLR